MAMTCACLVPVRWVGGFGDLALAACLWTAITVFTTTGSIPIASKPASVTSGVVAVIALAVIVPISEIDISCCAVASAF